jgi:hypothetical protein
MKKSISPALPVFLLLMGACSSPPPSPESSGQDNFWNSVPSGNLVFIGGANLRSSRDESVRLALEDIARKIAVFYAVEGEFVSYNKTGSGFFDYSSNTWSSIAYNEDYLGFTEDLEYDSGVDIIQIDNTIFVRARFRGPERIHLDYQAPPAGEGRPLWVDSPPAEISGYRVGLGYAGRRASHRDTVNASFEAAVFSIIRAAFGQAAAGDVGYRGSGTFDYRSASDAVVRARGRLKGFYVLDTWMDPSNMGVWTLAIARPALPGEREM